MGLMAIELVDQFGYEVTQTQPQLGLQTLPTSSRRNQIATLGTLDLTTIISYLLSAERGTLRYQMVMFDMMIERDAYLGSVLQTRRLALSQEDWRIIPGDENNSRAIEAAEMITDELVNLDSFDDDIEILLDAVPKGLSVMEIIYTDDWGIKALSEIPQNLLDWTQPELRVQAEEHGVPVPMWENKYIRHSPRLRPGPPLRRGLMRTLSVLWCISHFALEDWSGYSEVFGMPIRVGTYPKGSKKEDLAPLKEALISIGVDAMGMIPEGMMINFLEPMSRSIPGGKTTMEALINHCQTNYALTALGQAATTEDVGGTYGANKVKDRVRKDIRAGDARQLGTTMRRDLFRPVVGNRMGWDVPVPYMKWDLEDPVDEKGRADVFQVSLNMGMDLSRTQMREELNLREPQDDDDTLEGSGEIDSQPELNEANSENATRTQISDLFRGVSVLSPTSVNSEGEQSAVDKANDDLAEAGASSQEQAFASVVKHVAKLLKVSSTPEDLLAKLELITPGHNLLAEAKISRSDFAKTVARVMATADINGRLAVKEEAE